MRTHHTEYLEEGRLERGIGYYIVVEQPYLERQQDDLVLRGWLDFDDFELQDEGVLQKDEVFDVALKELDWGQVKHVPELRVLVDAHLLEVGYMSVEVLEVLEV